MKHLLTHLYHRLSEKIISAISFSILPNDVDIAPCRGVLSNDKTIMCGKFLSFVFSISTKVGISRAYQQTF